MYSNGPGFNNIWLRYSNYPDESRNIRNNLPMTTFDETPCFGTSIANVDLEAAQDTIQ